jgi:thymidylate kinase
MADFPAIVCLVGGDASGTSAQAAALTAELKQRGRAVVVVGVWDALSDPVVAPVFPFADREAVDAYLRVLSPRSRSHFMFHAVHIALDRAIATGPDLIIADAYWYEYFATEVVQGGDAAAMLAAASGFPDPARTVYLRVAPENTHSQNGYRAEDDGDGSLYAQYDTLAVLDSLSDTLSWILLDGTADRAESTRAMVDALADDGLV